VLILCPSSRQIDQLWRDGLGRRDTDHVLAKVLNLSAEECGVLADRVLYGDAKSTSRKREGMPAVTPESFQAASIHVMTTQHYGGELLRKSMAAQRDWVGSGGSTQPLSTELDAFGEHPCGGKNHYSLVIWDEGDTWGGSTSHVWRITRNYHASAAHLRLSSSIEEGVPILDKVTKGDAIVYGVTCTIEVDFVTQHGKEFLTHGKEFRGQDPSDEDDPSHAIVPGEEPLYHRDMVHHIVSRINGIRGQVGGPAIAILHVGSGMLKDGEDSLPCIWVQKACKSEWIAADGCRPVVRFLHSGYQVHTQETLRLMQLGAVHIVLFNDYITRSFDDPIISITATLSRMPYTNFLQMLGRAARPALCDSAHVQTCYRASAMHHFGCSQCRQATAQCIAGDVSADSLQLCDSAECAAGAKYAE
jgi:hypothetical protein